MFKILGADGKEYGPISADGVKEWIAQGRCVASTQIQKDGGQWVPLSAVPELAALLPAAPIVSQYSPGAAGPAKTSGLAIASLVLGILGLCTCGASALVGLILGIIAQVKISKSQGRVKGSGLAIAGICVSAVMMIFGAGFDAALLLPALVKAKQKALAIQCMNNMKQLAQDAALYAAQNQNKLPPAASWSDALDKFSSNPKAFICPAQPMARCGYSINGSVAGKDLNSVNPSTVLFFDSESGWNSSGGMAQMAEHRHGNTIVVVFVDGSSRLLTENDLATLRWNP